MIAEIAEGRRLGEPDLGSDRSIICPGFVDTHLHLPQFDCIGVDGLTLLDWLRSAVFPTEVRWQDAAHAGHAAARAARRLLSHGTTAIAAYATVHHAGTQAAIHAAGDAGLRGVIGQVLMDQQAPTELIRPAGQLLEEAARLLGHGRIWPAVTPRFAVSCSDALLAGAGALAAKSGWMIQSHLSEMREECDLVRRLHPGSGGGEPTYTEVYARAGLLTRRTVLGHGIWLSDGERQLLAAAGTVIAHCPTANLFLQAGLMDRAGHLQAGVRVALGSDVAGGPDISMVRVARAMIETAKRARMADGQTPIPSAAEAFWQITAGNADAIGMSDAGRIAAGDPADLVVIDPDRAAGLGLSDAARDQDPLSALLYGWDERCLSHTLSAGRVVYSG